MTPRSSSGSKAASASLVVERAMRRTAASVSGSTASQEVCASMAGSERMRGS